MNETVWSTGTIPLGKFLSDLAKRYFGVLAGKLEKTGLNRYYYALLIICEEQEKNLTQQKFADILNTDKVSTVRIVDFLSKKGLVKRQVNPDDRREHLLVATPKAFKILPSIQQAFDELENAAFEGLSDKEKKEVSKALFKMQENLNKLPSGKVQVKIIHSTTNKRSK